MKTVVGSTVGMGLCIGILVWAVQTAAQPGAEARGPRQFDPEVQKTIWKLQTDSLSSALGLSAEAAIQLATAYQTTRQSLFESMRASMQDRGGDREAFMQKMQQSREEAKQTFAKEIAAFLNQEQTEKATEMLGSFSSFYDRMTQSLSEIVEDRKVLLQTVSVVGTHLIPKKEAQEGQAESQGERGGMRGWRWSPEVKEKVDAELAKLLTEEQLAKWKEATNRPVRQRGGEQGDRERGNRQ